MGRDRGFWWAPDGRSLLVARVDVSPVRHVFIGDAAHPERRPRAVRYPSAGTANADVSLHVVGLDGQRTDVCWDRTAFEYLVTAGWEDGNTLAGANTGADTGAGAPASVAASGAGARPRPVLSVQSR
ncbi:DPP IV N-terminal domain-containing protein, partial [Streptomyces sp. AC627_RSS907]|uniref:DPP IV N-terminal domain-containing protein n=1 Tax=Streptomyces sp. AC627_RSS907 TaxID=2823684 RepID=UPI0035B2F75C